MSIIETFDKNKEFEGIYEDIDSLIFNNLNYLELINLVETSPRFMKSNYIKNKILKLEQEREEFINQYFSDELIELFGGIKTMKTFNLIKKEDFKDKWIGIDYIDCIYYKDLDDTINMGIDKFDRPYVVFVAFKNFENKYLGTKKYCQPYVECLFQRYTARENSWANGGDNIFNIYGGYFFNGNNKLQNYFKENLNAIIESRKNNDFNIHIKEKFKYSTYEKKVLTSKIIKETHIHSGLRFFQDYKQKNMHKY